MEHRPTTDSAELFFAELYPELVGGLGLHIGDRELAEDVAQQAIVKAWVRWKAVSKANDPRAWVWRVALNESSSVFRRRDAERRALRRVALPSATTAPTDVPMAHVVRAAVRALPERERAVVVLRFFADLSVDAAAEVLGIAPGTVKATTYHAIRKLRLALPVDVEEALSHE